MGPSVEKMFTYFKNHDLGLCLLLRVLNCYWGICLQCSQIATKGAPPPPRPGRESPLPTAQNASRVGGARKIGRAGGEGWEEWGGRSVAGGGGHGEDVTAVAP